MPLPTSTEHDLLRIAAVVPPPGIDADQPVREFVADLRSRGIRVTGLLQDTREENDNCFVCLIDIETGTSYPILQCKTEAASACALDTAALIETTTVMRRIAGNAADLVVFNRFSGMEADGDGFAAEMLDFMSRDIPVLTIVRERHLPAWRHFTGGMACELPPDLTALNAWFATIEHQA